LSRFQNACFRASAPEIAARTVRAVRKLCSGVHIMSIGWEHRIPDILRASVRP